MAIKYEHMVQDPQHAFRAIFQYCGEISFDHMAVERAFSRDSQRNMDISRANLRNYRPVIMTKDVQRQLDFVCDSFKVIIRFSI